MKYNQIYSINKNVWGEAPNKSLQLLADDLGGGGCFLDLGCGTGRDSLFMARKGYITVAIDNSEKAIEVLQDRAKAEGLEIDARVMRVEDFDFENDKYSVINIFNVLNFIKKEQAVAVLEKAKRSLKEGGYLVLNVFTTDDAFYARRKENGYFSSEELLEMFSDYKKVFYRVVEEKDPGHAGCEEAHVHDFLSAVFRR